MGSDATTTRPKPFIFVLMPFDQKFNDIYKFGIRGAAEDVGAYAERVDEQIFTEGILDRIFNQISKADVIVADMTGRNPNVFYEVGYAHALGKIVLLLTQDSNDIPFDLKHRQHTVYGGQIDVLRRELVTKLQWAIAESRRRQGGDILERISIRIHDVPIVTGISPEELPEIHGSVSSLTFRLPVHLRNDSVETLLGVTHVYLFAPKDASVVPYKMEDIWSSSSPIRVSWSTLGRVEPAQPYKQPKPTPLESIVANPIDAPDGLVRQFRLPIAFPALPPGAIEEQNISLMFIEEQTHCNSVYRLRLHSARQYHDYTFRLRVAFKAKGEADSRNRKSSAKAKSSAGPQKSEK